MMSVDGVAGEVSRGVKKLDEAKFSHTGELLEQTHGDALLASVREALGDLSLLMSAASSVRLHNSVASTYVRDTQTVLNSAAGGTGNPHLQTAGEASTALVEVTVEGMQAANQFSRDLYSLRHALLHAADILETRIIPGEQTLARLNDACLAHEATIHTESAAYLSEIGSESQQAG